MHLWQLCASEDKADVIALTWDTSHFAGAKLPKSKRLNLRICNQSIKYVIKFTV